MDWQTKEYLDSRIDELEQKLDAIMRHFNIEETEEDYSDDEELDVQEEEKEFVDSETIIE
jgi:hypothetical protein